MPIGIEVGPAQRLDFARTATGECDQPDEEPSSPRNPAALHKAIECVPEGGEVGEGEAILPRPFLETIEGPTMENEPLSLPIAEFSEFHVVLIAPGANGLMK